MTRNWVDGFGRKIEYVRISVTDRCDFRCIYCMAENMTFLPRQRVLTLEEIERSAGGDVQILRFMNASGG